MAEIITLPKMSDTMTEGVIVRWTVKVGDSVKSGDIIAEVETDKATMDMEVYSKGQILHLIASEGQAIPVDAAIAIVGQPGEDFQALLSGAASAGSNNNSTASNTESSNNTQVTQAPA